MTGSEQGVAILPYHLRLGFQPSRLPLDDLLWPLGQPARLKGGQLRDLGADDHLIIFPKNTVHIRPGFGTKANVSIMVLEPAAIHKHHLQRLRVTWRRFHRVLTLYEPLLDAIPNGIFFPFGGSWVPEWRSLRIDKQKDCGLIASGKRSQEGHVLRHEIADWISETNAPVDLLGRGYAPFENKSDGLAPYRYSVVIENVRERNHFTEKLIDTLLCETIPIYWGCPNISDFFDAGALIPCADAAALKAAISAASAEDYAARLPLLKDQKESAAHYGDVYGRAARSVLNDTTT